MTVSQLSDDDIDRIVDVMGTAFDPAFGEAWNRRQVTDALTIGNCRYGIVDSTGHAPEQGIAAAGFFMIRGVLDEAELLLLAVKPEIRGRGLGRKLLEMFEADATNHGQTRLFLEMRAGNPAEFLYRKFGFTQIGRRPKYYTGADGTRLDALTFEKLLPS
ncbi:putative ribosomal-protein-alanine acetyltransferase [Caenibius tardaugens NBRC 16725]|uniref:Putative ribosomal-protein-alanine acetyltransferase n=1 Tax=Caenibius tardaugens NBRC 16725 TaxID=1219035 RepID=U2ZRQ5_9SPHN|nr:GNAT family N-acetyltransferase [Caenibius tardaugens]AZI34549.1 GNAT family N-acetyltransferase [Caenibius tardaugens NBRC 16725]GAD48049.1 putative ribosomal-protein-alanine acetyltransferase [Caenibius tardaugens NBRC 16725]